MELQWECTFCSFVNVAPGSVCIACGTKYTDGCSTPWTTVLVQKPERNLHCTENAKPMAVHIQPPRTELSCDRMSFASATPFMQSLQSYDKPAMQNIVRRNAAADPEYDYRFTYVPTNTANCGTVHRKEHPNGMSMRRLTRVLVQWLTAKGLTRQAECVRRLPMTPSRTAPVQDTAHMQSSGAVALRLLQHEEGIYRDQIDRDWQIQRDDINMRMLQNQELTERLDIAQVLVERDKLLPLAVEWHLWLNCTVTVKRLLDIYSIEGDAKDLNSILHFFWPDFWTALHQSHAQDERARSAITAGCLSGFDNFSRVHILINAACLIESRQRLCAPHTLHNDLQRLQNEETGLRRAIELEVGSAYYYTSQVPLSRHDIQMSLGYHFFKKCKEWFRDLTADGDIESKPGPWRSCNVCGQQK